MLRIDTETIFLNTYLGFDELFFDDGNSNNLIEVPSHFKNNNFFLMNKYCLNLTDELMLHYFKTQNTSFLLKFIIFENDFQNCNLESLVKKYSSKPITKEIVEKNNSKFENPADFAVLKKLLENANDSLRHCIPKKNAA